VAKQVDAVALEATGFWATTGSNPVECIITTGLEMKKKPKKVGKTRGPKPQRLKIDGDWEAAVGKAVKKAPPAKHATSTNRQ
jgi:hypothetical protein